MAEKLPKWIVLKSAASKKCAYYLNEPEQVRGQVRCGEDSVFAPFARIELESSKSHTGHLHLRFYHSNRYWSRGPNRWIAAASSHPDDDKSNPSSTLFKPSFSSDNAYLYLNHVQSGGGVEVDNDGRLYVNENPSSRQAFAFVDWETLVQLPRSVTFKGDNEMYLKGVWYGTPWKDGYPYLQFSGEDYNHEYVAYEVYSHPDGHLRVKSVHFDKFWRRSPNWIWGDSTDSSGNDVDTLFWPVKIDDRTVALRNAGNNHFCKRLTTDGKTSCLNAGINSITQEARMVVEELVLERSIYNVRYRMEDSRVYDETPFVAGVGTAVNDSDSDSTFAIKVSYVDTASSSFTYTLSLALGVKSTIEAGIPFVADGKIEVSASLTNTFVWGKTNQTSRTADATYTAKVPPRTRVVVNYVGTQGKCSVPFSYTQRQKMSSDGAVVKSEHVDGVFCGVNYYSFRFEQLKFLPL